MAKKGKLEEILRKYESDLLEDRIKGQLADVTFRRDLLSENDLRQQSSEFVRLFRTDCKTSEAIRLCLAG